MEIEKRTLIITLKFSSYQLYLQFWESDLKKKYNRKGPIHYIEPKSGGLHKVIIRFNNKIEFLSTDNLAKMKAESKAGYIDQKIES